MTKIRNKTVLITGGANGLGKLLAARCLKMGASKVVLWDINETLLDETTTEFAHQGFTVHPYAVDVSDINDVEQAATDVLLNVGMVDVLFNNAGIVAGNKTFVEHSAKDINKTIEVNVMGVMHVTRVFLPDMIRKKQGHIINIASAAGLIPNPKMSVYASSKWAVIGWSESLRLELEAVSKRLHVTTITPSYINTGMFDGVKTPWLTPILDPHFVVNEIMKGVRYNKIVVREPFMVKSLPLLRGLLPPRMFDLIAGRMFGVYKTMENFVGRPKSQRMPEKNKRRKSTRLSKKMEA